MQRHGCQIYQLRVKLRLDLGSAWSVCCYSNVRCTMSDYQGATSINIKATQYTAAISFLVNEVMIQVFVIWDRRIWYTLPWIFLEVVCCCEKSIALETSSRKEMSWCTGQDNRVMMLVLNRDWQSRGIPSITLMKWYLSQFIFQQVHFNWYLRCVEGVIVAIPGVLEFVPQFLYKG